jgi:hypothetical protein
MVVSSLIPDAVYPFSLQQHLMLCGQLQVSPTHLVPLQPGSIMLEQLAGLLSTWIALYAFLECGVMSMLAL